MSHLRRRRDWERRLELEIVRASTRRFRYSSHDCLRFPARCVQAMTGHYPAHDFTAVRSAKKADAVIKKAGGLIKLVSSVMAAEGFLDILPLKAGRGDVVIVKTPGGLSGGIVGLDGRTVYAAKKPVGIVDIPLTLAAVKRAWKIG